MSTSDHSITQTLPKLLLEDAQWLKSMKEKSQYAFLIPTGLADQDKLNKALKNFRIFLYTLLHFSLGCTKAAPSLFLGCSLSEASVQPKLSFDSVPRMQQIYQKKCLRAFGVKFLVSCKCCNFHFTLLCVADKRVHHKNTVTLFPGTLGNNFLLNSFLLV